MKESILLATAVLIALFGFCLVSAGHSQACQIKIKYACPGRFENGRFPDAATAYCGQALVAIADAVKVVKKPSGPDHIIIRETHFERGHEVYSGLLEFALRPGGGILVKGMTFFGERRRDIFIGWPSCE